MAAEKTWVPPVSFYFRVVIQGSPKIPDTDFLEVSGLKMEMQVEELKEGGQNDFVHSIPKMVKHGNLVLKRALEPLDNSLETWIKDTLEGGFAKKIKPRNIVVYLMDAEGKALRCWWCSNAYPVKWEVNTFNAKANELAVETLELCYNLLERKK